VGRSCVVRGLARVVKSRSAVVAERGSAEHDYDDVDVGKSEIER
jgi:hypothetical protein